MFVAADPHAEAGKRVNSGHCVPLVRKATGAPDTSQWRRGEQVRGAAILRGTAIATFDERGRYENDVTGRSHAAIYLDQTDDGLRVVDQWVGHPTAERIIQFRGGAGDAVNDGDRFYVVTV